MLHMQPKIDPMYWWPYLTLRGAGEFNTRMRGLFVIRIGGTIVLYIEEDYIRLARYNILKRSRSLLLLKNTTQILSKFNCKLCQMINDLTQSSAANIDEAHQSSMCFCKVFGLRSLGLGGLQAGISQQRHAHTTKLRIMLMLGPQKVAEEVAITYFQAPRSRV